MTTLRQRLARAILAVALGFTVAPADAGTLISDTLPAGDHSGSRDRDYQVYVPEQLPDPAAMVMALHGCGQSDDNVMDQWGLKAAADRFGFVLVAPFITSYDGLRNENCWGFWFDRHRQEGRGEPEDLHRLARHIESQYTIDPKRRYITGLSSGGAMAVVAATTHNEYWAAAASAAGLPYGESAASVSFYCPGFASFHSVGRVAEDMRAELDNDYPIPLMVLQNNNDCTVIQPAGHNLRDAHLRVFGSDGRDTAEAARKSETSCTPYYREAFDCVHTRYGDSGERSTVETVFFDGPIDTANTADTDHGHYWVGGADGQEGPWAVRTGPSYPDLIWDFFQRHPRTAAPPVEPQCTDWYATNTAHHAAGRAYYGIGYFTVGGDDALGFASLTEGWVHETTTGVFEAGRCP